MILLMEIGIEMYEDTIASMPLDQIKLILYLVSGWKDNIYGSVGPKSIFDIDQEEPREKDFYNKMLSTMVELEKDKGNIFIEAFSVSGNGKKYDVKFKDGAKTYIDYLSKLLSERDIKAMLKFKLKESMYIYFQAISTNREQIFILKKNKVDKHRLAILNCISEDIGCSGREFDYRLSIIGDECTIKFIVGDWK